MEKISYDHQDIIENMPMAFAYHKVIYDQDMKPTNYIFLEINKKFEELTGLKKNEIVGKKVTEVLNNIAESKFDWIKFYAEIALKGESRTINQYSEPLDKWYKIKAYSNQKGYFTTIFSDITEQKKKEQEIMYNKKRYQIIFNSAPIGIIIEDEKGGIIEVNEVLSESIGYSKGELEGSSVFEKLIMPEHYDLARENIKKILSGEDLEFDISSLNKNDQIKDYHLKETNITLPDGSKGIISMHLDITKRKKLENSLKEKNILLNSILESIQDGIAVLNNDLTIEYTNPTMEKWVKNQSSLIGKKCFLGFYDKKDVCDDCPVVKSLKTGKMEKTIKKLPVNFDIDFIEIFSYPIYDEKNDRVKGVVEFIRDISERVEQEKEIRYLAYKDELTDLYNRKFFELELKSLDTKEKLPISIVMGDLNGLKIINDSYGQKMGDQLLIKTANLLKEIVSDDDIVARYGGDEFIIILPKTTEEAAQELIKNIRLKSKKQPKDKFSLSIALGTATKDKKEQKITSTVKIAENNMLQNKLSASRSSKNNIVQGLLNTLSAKSSETKEHAVRMTKLAFDFGEALGLSNSELNELSLLATLHDIGKSTISEDVLNKPGRLNEEEWNLIKSHPEKGYKIACASEEFAIIADDILSHHEKWDGSGYPNQLKGEEIPYLARIITLVDSYDVMTNDRPYSKAISNKEALKEIKRCAGSQFDPNLAEVFIQMMGK
jgi:diguanylate cyclase (GGDEF)-like protein/PAS domain S-box-containing protein